MKDGANVRKEDGQLEGRWTTRGGARTSFRDLMGSKYGQSWFRIRNGHHRHNCHHASATHDVALPTTGKELDRNKLIQMHWVGLRSIRGLTTSTALVSLRLHISHCSCHRDRHSAPCQRCVLFLRPSWVLTWRACTDASTRLRRSKSTAVRTRISSFDSMRRWSFGSWPSAGSSPGG